MFKDDLGALFGACAVWAAFLVAGTVGPFDGDPVAAAAIVGVGWMGVLAARGGAALAVAVVVALAAGPELLPWAIAAGLANVLLIARGAGRAVPVRLDSEMQRQLMRSRRRDERATVLVARADRAAATSLEDLVASLRATDALEVLADGDGWELRAVLDGEDPDRDAVEQRVVGVATAAGVRFGWAEFPADGMTLEVLVEHARVGLAAPDRVPSLVMARQSVTTQQG